MNTNMIDSNKIGANIKRLVKEKYRSQKTFAKACVDNYIINSDYELGDPLKVVNRWLNGGIKKLSTVYDLANFLEVDVMAILF